MFGQLVAAVCFVAFSLTKDFLQNVQRWICKIKQFILIKAKTNLRLLFILFLSFVEVFLNIGRTLIGDSQRYVNLSLFFLGKYPFLYDTMYTQIVVMRPMIPLLASPFIIILGNVYLSFGLVSGFFWVGGVVVSYKLGLMFLEDRDLATLVALSYIFAPPLLVYGAGVMTDSAGFFFIGLAVYFTLTRERQNGVSSKTYFFDALIVSLGVLFKESVLFALFFMIAKRFVKRKGFLETLLAATLVGIFELLFLHTLGFGLDIFIYKYLLATQVHTPSKDWGVIPYLISLIGAYVTNTVPSRPYFTSLIFWIWILPTLLFGLFTVLGFMFNARRKDLLICMLFLFPSSVIWPAMRSRFSFSMWPAVLPAMVSGAYLVFSRLPLPKERIISNPKIYMFFLVLCVGVINTVDTLIRYPRLL